MPHPLLIYLVWLAALSLVTFCVYAWDKRRAAKNGWRVAEKRLHLLSLCGGFPGAFAAQRMLRHKTSKVGFQVTYWLTVALHVGLVVGVWYLTTGD